MEIQVEHELDQLEADLPPGRVARPPTQHRAPGLSDIVQAARSAVELPRGFPALRQALTPDDHVAVVVDPRLPQLPLLLDAIVEHILSAGIEHHALTFVLPPGSAMGWCDDLSGPSAQVKVELHEPANRKRLSYLATTRGGHRLYLNRTVVEADQVVVVTGRRYDALLGHGGAEGALYPAFADEDTYARLWEKLSIAAPGSEPRPLKRESAEACWLLGVPFMVQVIEGAGTDIAHILGGTPERSAEGARLLDERWRWEIDGPADTVVAAVSGGPGRPDFADMAQALATAARVVKPDGRIILWGRMNPELGPSAELLRRAGDPERGLAELRDAAPTDIESGYQWASAVQGARVYMLSGLPEETAEELFTVPLEHAGQMRRVIGTDGSCLIISDANKALVVPKDHGPRGKLRRKSR